MSAKLMDYFNQSPRLGIIATADKDGRVDEAVFGSPRMIDEKIVVIATANNRTFANLQENPHAVFMIMDPKNMEPGKMESGEGILAWKGIRVYLKMKEYTTSGEMLDEIRIQSAKFVGEEAAKMIHAAVTFEIYEVRPLVDFGQGWEKSI